MEQSDTNGNRARLLKYYKCGDWEKIINMFGEDENMNDRFYDELYLWVQPSKSNLYFIGEELRKLSLDNLISVGCGSGLLEWLIHCATGVNTIGLEVDRGWWESEHAPPTFLPLQYADEEPSRIIMDHASALLFCYFNNKPAFEQYMNYYRGKCLIVIGPGVGRGTHTHPEPFNLKLDTNDWQLSVFQEIRYTKDFIAVYIR